MNPLVSPEDMLFLVKTYIGADRLTLQKYLGYDKVVGRRHEKRVVRKEGLFEFFGFASRARGGRGWILNVEMLPKRKQRKLYEYH